MSDDVARDPRAIGFVGFAYLRNAKALAIRSVCGMSYAPTQFNVKTEEYPLSRRLFLYTPTNGKSEHARSLLDYALSDAAQPTIVATGFIDQTIDYLHFRQQPYRIAFAFSDMTEEFNMDSMKELVTLVSEAQRMSATLRFERNESQLDLKAKQDAARLARYLKTPEMQGKQVLLIGFVDSPGPFASNLTVSQARAETVRSAILAASGKELDPKQIIARGFSETRPVDCNGTPEGRAKNRRVEVWVRDHPAAEAKAPQPGGARQAGRPAPATTGALPPKTGQQQRPAGAQAPRPAQPPRAAQQ